MPKSTRSARRNNSLLFESKALRIGAVTFILVYFLTLLFVDNIVNNLHRSNPVLVFNEHINEAIQQFTRNESFHNFGDENGADQSMNGSRAAAADHRILNASEPEPESKPVNITNVGDITLNVTEPDPYDGFLAQELQEGGQNAIYIVINGKLNHLLSCLPCGEIFNLCDKIDFVPWEKVKDYPIASPFKCGENSPPSVLKLLDEFSFDTLSVIAGDTGSAFYCYNNTVVHIESCMDCGPLYGSICDRFPIIPHLPSFALSRIGRWPPRTYESQPLDDTAPVFLCHRDVKDMIQPVPSNRWLLISLPHVLYLANMVSNALKEHGFSAEISTTMPTNFDQHDLFVVLSANAFKLEDLPPAEKLIIIQLEQRSSQWFTREYLHALRDSYAVLEYNYENLSFLKQHDVNSNVWYLPVGGDSSLMQTNDGSEKKKSYDLLFYGDVRSERRKKMLNELQKNFKVKIVTETFGADMQALLQQAKFVINIHYYEDPSLEVFRIFESLSYGAQVISEDAPDSWMYPELKSIVSFFELGSIDSMLQVVREALARPDGEGEKARRDTIHLTHSKFLFSFNRFLFGMELIPITALDDVGKYSTISIPRDIKEPLILSMPEFPNRRDQFRNHVSIKAGPLFDGIRHKLRASWMSCAMSYSTIASLALNDGVKQLSIAEDDVLFPSNYGWRMEVIEEYLNSLNGEWDLFSGLIADVNPKTKILSAEMYQGIQFITIDKMTSTVFNVYNTKVLELLAHWDPTNENVAINTVDRFIESQKELRIVVALPFLVGHREEAYSTIWAHDNAAYKSMISASQAKLFGLLTEFVDNQSRPAMRKRGFIPGAWG